MTSNLAKAAVGALALNGGGENYGNAPPPNYSNNNPIVDTNGNTGPVPECPSPPLPKYHEEAVCLMRPYHTPLKNVKTRSYRKIKAGGIGATLVPNQQTLVCPIQVQNLENPSAMKGFDTVWIVENTASTSVVVSWVVDGVEWSPFQPDIKPMDDPSAILKPGDFAGIPTFESFVYHVREITEDGTPGDVLLQHRAGLVPLKNRNEYPCDASTPDVEPVDPVTGKRKDEWARTPTHQVRLCNTVDVGFRNEAGCPLHVYWDNHMVDVPTEGFNDDCGEKFKFHLGTKPATRNFAHDWESATKFEATYVPHTFVARLASDPNVVIDSYSVQPTRVIDCPKRKQKVAGVCSSEGEAEAVVGAEGTVQPLL